VVFPISFLPFCPCWNLVCYSTHLTDSHKCAYSVIGSLAGVSYFGPVAGHGFISHDLELLREERRKVMQSTHDLGNASVSVLPAGEGADHFVIIQKKEAEEPKGEQPEISEAKTTSSD